MVCAYFSSTPLVNMTQFFSESSPGCTRREKSGFWNIEMGISVKTTKLLLYSIVETKL